jgi:predicted Ser/Thr protein kinase
MDNISNALQHLNRTMTEQGQRFPVSFEEYLEIATARPYAVIRNVFQVFHDMIKSYVQQGIDEYPEDPESIKFVYYDTRKLFSERSDQPFFADRLFTNRLMNLVEALRRGAQQNKIYIFEGPPGSGKSTFLNNLLMKFEEYANTAEGAVFESVWRLDVESLASTEYTAKRFLSTLSRQESGTVDTIHSEDDYIEVPCPSHDNPILIIPKDYRKPFFDDLFESNPEFKEKLFSLKEYEWVFKDYPCTICSSLYQSLLDRLKSPLKVFEMLYARPYRFNRRVGEGISVFNSGDKRAKSNFITNSLLQNRINECLKDSNRVKYIFSSYAKTNNGIYALMDVKSHNTDRLSDLHNIVSEGVHKVEEIEENVKSLFLALMNPEDKANIQDFQAFSDRVEYINIPYVLDLDTEVEIYRNIFGRNIDACFLPRVLHDFTRVIISSRLNIRSEALLEWIGDPEKYRLYCDENLQLLKMEIYRGHIPSWLSEEDRKRFTAKRRRMIIAESEKEGNRGFSGRDSIKIFNEFFCAYAIEGKLINMSTLFKFFTKTHRELSESVPSGFLDSLVRLYNYSILQEVKESLYYYNEEQISRDIQNYLFAVNFEIGSVEVCKYTGERLEITEEFLEGIERHLLGERVQRYKRLSFRKDVQNEYTSKTLTQEILVEGKRLPETNLYQSLYSRYVYSLKEKVLDPFLENENFRSAIKDYEEKGFKTYDKKIREDVTFLMNNLCKKFHYTKQGAKEVCMYVIDNELASKFANRI